MVFSYRPYLLLSHISHLSFVISYLPLIFCYLISPTYLLLSHISHLSFVISYLPLSILRLWALILNLQIILTCFDFWWKESKTPWWKFKHFVIFSHQMSWGSHCCITYNKQCLRANPLTRGSEQVKLDSNKWKLWNNLFAFG